jgi:hypothetical protein
MAGDHMQVFRHLHIVNRKMEGQVTQGLGLAAVKPEK